MIQARTGSTRFPKKVLAKIGKKPMIWYIIERMKQVIGIDQIILVTTKNPQDKILLEIAKECEIFGFRGKTNDVLDRFYQCAIKFDADPIIRITGDCPLIDPIVVKNMLNYYKKKKFDYMTNVFPPTFPDGLDVEIFSFKTLARINHKAELKSDREHVTSYVKNHPDEFRIFNYENKQDLSHLRWTVDEKKDLDLIRLIYENMQHKFVFYMKDVINIVKKNRNISLVNYGINRNEGYLISLKKDKSRK